MTEPQVKEISISARSGGTVQIVKYNLQNEFCIDQSVTYSIPEGWTDEQVDEFKRTKTLALQEEIQPFAQNEQDALLAQSDWWTPADG